MGSLSGSGLQGRIRRPSMVSRPVAVIVSGAIFDNITVIFPGKCREVTYGAHDGCLPVKLQKVAVSMVVLVHLSPSPLEGVKRCRFQQRQGRQRTRSSPIGPAEHEEGGSLCTLVSQLSRGSRPSSSLASSAATLCRASRDLSKGDAEGAPTGQGPSVPC
jgi:hypothetical protein